MTWAVVISHSARDAPWVVLGINIHSGRTRALGSYKRTGPDIPMSSAVDICVYRCCHHLQPAITFPSKSQMPSGRFRYPNCIGGYNNSVMQWTHLGIDLAYDSGVMVSYSGWLVRHVHNYVQTPCTESNWHVSCCILTSFNELMYSYYICDTGYNTANTLCPSLETDCISVSPPNRWF